MKCFKISFLLVIVCLGVLVKSEHRKDALHESFFVKNEFSEIEELTDLQVVEARHSLALLEEKPLDVLQIIIDSCKPKVCIKNCSFCEDTCTDECKSGDSSKCGLCIDKCTDSCASNKQRHIERKGFLRVANY